MPRRRQQRQPAVQRKRQRPQRNSIRSWNSRSIKMADWFSEPRRNKSGIRRTMLAAGVFVMTGVCVSAAAPDSGRVTAVRFWSLGDVTRIAIEVSSDFTFKYNHLSDPERMFFDIHGARPDLTSGTRNGARTIPVGDALLGQIRVAETQPEVTRVVLDLAQT